MTRAYSYLRFSTPEQERGDSFRRQTSMAEAYAVKNGLQLDERSFRDLGVSAFRGANAETGMLGEFLNLVRCEAIPQGSFLLVESLDRLSRNKPRKAVRLLESICEEGI
ncbi:MAG TPA: recombinase family protein, partial [Stellaceae bacterium]|nr:recombinase family protein [Stellaceae bacterium]